MSTENLKHHAAGSKAIREFTLTRQAEREVPEKEE
jgi:hypothetical protein